MGLHFPGNAPDTPVKGSTRRNLPWFPFLHQRPSDMLHATPAMHLTISCCVPSLHQTPYDSPPDHFSSKWVLAPSSFVHKLICSIEDFQRDGSQRAIRSWWWLVSGFDGRDFASRPPAPCPSAPPQNLSPDQSNVPQGQTCQHYFSLKIERLTMTGDVNTCC